MICEAVDKFPHSSIAVHVLVTLYEPAHAPELLTSSDVRVKSLPHASVALAVAKTGVDGQFIVVSGGNVAMIGAVTS